jgi:type I restriction enzyme M protein
MLTPEIKTKINQLWDKFWSGGIANPLTAIEQISYLLFMKRLDEIDTEKKKKAEFAGEKYTSMFSGNFVPGNRNAKANIMVKAKDVRWSSFKHLSPTAMLDLVTAKAFPFIKELNPEEFPFSKYMKDAVCMIPKPSLLDEAVKIIDGIYDEIEKQRTGGQLFHDTLGDVYEFLLNEISVSGKNGQFRTPRHIIRMMAEMVDPDITDKICDPTCGTGGFLVGAYQYILSKYSSEKNLLPEDENGFRNGIGDKIKDKRLWEKLRTKTFYGFDFDTSMVRFGLMNLMLHDISHPNIEYMDTLGKRYDAYETPGQYSVILANPPFKGSIDSDDKGMLRIESNKTELLFIDRIMRMLQTGGRAGVIIPDGVLFGGSNSHKQLRKLLLQTCELKAVISMPGGVFKPYAGVSTGILLFTKVEEENKKAKEDGKGWHTQQVWFYDMGIDGDGYSLDDNRRPLNTKPLPGIVGDYKEYTGSKKKSADKKHKHFYVPIADIIANELDLSLNRYKEIHYDEATYEPPKEILAKLIAMEKEILKDMNSLNELIK